MAEKEVAAKLKQNANQTVRERTAETSTKADRTKRFRVALQAILIPFRFVGQVIARVGRFKPFHLIGLVLVPKYFRNSWKELRQVTWPNHRETRQLVVAVIVFATIFGVLIALTDYGLDKVFKKVVLKQ